MTAAVLHPPEEVLLGFARALRAAGVAVTADRERTYLEAVAAVGLDDQPAVYHAGRATLCASPADLERHDLVVQFDGAERLEVEALAAGGTGVDDARDRVAVL